MSVKILSHSMFELLIGHPHTVKTYRKRRALAALALVAVTALAAVGCSSPGGPTPSQEGGQPVSGGTLHLAFRSDDTAKTTLDPIQQQWLEHRTVLRNVVESLTDQDPKTGEIIPWLASGWDVSPDQTQYTFHLHDGITFSNGQPFNAQAVKTSFDSNAAAIQRNPTVFGATYLAGFKSADVIDDKTIKITLNQPNGSFLQSVSTVTLGILAPESYAKTVEERNLGALVGTGPFTIESYTPQKGIVIKRRPDYQPKSAVTENKGDAYLDSVEFTYIPEDSVRVGNLSSGAVDVAAPRNPFTQADIDLLKASGVSFTSFSLPGTIEGLYPNVKNGGPLADRNVRLAVQAAVDRASYASTVFGTDYPVAEGVYDVSTPFFKSETDKLGFDLNRSNQLLDQAGWTVGQDGYRFKDGKRLDLVYPVTSEATGDVLVQDQLRQAGIHLELKVLTAGDQTEAISNGDWDFTRGVLTRGDPSILGAILDRRVSRAPDRAQNSVTDDVSAQLETLFDKGLANADDAARANAYAKIQDLLIDNGLIFPVFERVQQVGYRDNVHGIKFSAEGFLDFRDTWISR
ncbi:MAG: peptide/nickel transport system substrate-binding protein [Mycobacterium sp.]|nr:peptide/nickel transport system substrate-binding protein [Mycobacterium sp.]